jgi:hypothetical protein
MQQAFAVGERSRPLDDCLIALGGAFSSAVRADNFALALKLIDLIEQRLALLPN